MTINLQNQPSRSKEAKQIRSVFIASPGYKLVSWDLSQIEVRILAHESQDKNMLYVLRSGGDVHRQTASDIFGISPELITKQQREPSKDVTFGKIYGQSISGLADQIQEKVPDELVYAILGTKDLSLQGKLRKDAYKMVAIKFNNAFDKRYPGVNNWAKYEKEKARKLGYVETFLGRKRLVPGINSSISKVRHEAEKIAINTKVQGGAADYLKVAMINISDYLREKHLKTRLLIQIHDELVAEVPENEIKKVIPDIKELMTSAYELMVPVLSDVEIGNDWGNLIPYEDYLKGGFF